MRTRHPFQDVEESGPAPTIPLDIEFPPGMVVQGTPVHSPIAWHQGENRRTRRAEVAKFAVQGEPMLRRMLLKQRQRQRRGKMDVELNRLRREKAK